ncbi:hypothetical protein [Francisella philomiragia]|uniref:Uncharacterized protein n=1 Tax=Francisella philomiragia TaxID=28110 RepID=A0ABS1GCC4_9GAMM|nr:hypothetical protein [Francisella philomiragia]MBK2258725.1 hypothetical protein [Francisella philomiragia]MBK2302416.1 hypothetical protein [Francisella philomiragia]
MSFLQDRITATKDQIVALEDAATDLMSGTIQTYTLDTGQSRQVVTKHSIGTINRVLDSLYNRLSILESRQKGGGTIVGRPAW